MSVRKFDFSTLYTKIPHNLLKEDLFEIVDFVFKGGISNLVYVTKMVRFGGNLWGDFQMYSKMAIKTILEFIIDNAYYQGGYKIFKQIIGIPMGSDPAPFIANLFHLCLGK